MSDENDRRSSRANFPAAQGYRMPAEWEPHESTWLAWPHFRDDWPGKFEPIPWVYAEIVRTLARHERVNLIVNDASWEQRARTVLEKADALSDNISFHRWRTNRVWTRDSGCIFLTPSAEHHQPMRGCLLCIFSSTAGPSIRITISTKKLARAWRRPLARAWCSRFLLIPYQENIASCLKADRSTSTAAALCSPLKNACSRARSSATRPWIAPPMSNVRRLFWRAVLIWLDSGIAGDDTHGHVDDITVRRSGYRGHDGRAERTERKSLALHANLGRLRTPLATDGRKLDVVEIPMPHPVVFEGRQLPASYANFYIANGTVLVPVFNGPNDRIALNTLQSVSGARNCADLLRRFDLGVGRDALHDTTATGKTRGRELNPATSLF